MTKYTAVLIEPRKHKALPFVLNNFFENLSDEWSFVIFHGNKNHEYIMDIMENQLPQYKHRVIQYVNLNIDNFNNLIEYSMFVINPFFYSCIPSEIFLMFQTDTMIFKENKLLINNFLKYDYVGAPWHWDECVGNGGLSLRRKSKMLEIINNVPYHFNNEDIYFCTQKVIPLNRPSFEEAQYFSIETVFNETSFGIHNAWRYIASDKLNYLLEKYPELNTLKNLQG